MVVISFFRKNFQFKVANAPHLRILDPDFVGTGFLHQPEGSFLTLRRRSCKCFAFSDFESRLHRNRLSSSARQVIPDLSAEESQMLRICGF